MPKFTVRVELHNHQNGDYDVLHAAMKEQGFSRTIAGEDGGVFHLPTAEYDISGDFDTDVVLKKAHAAAVKTKRDHTVLVTQSAGRQWGLWKM